ncbi:MAG TPA: Crp/Fnr family transcriptional regulator [Actinomycetota bacterium]|nr:Crp/Fnr family transcriptional regulator [Actinomycetota bacterium]
MSVDGTPGERDAVVNALANSPFLSVASKRALMRLAQAATVIDYEAGDTIFKQRDLPTEVYVIEAGAVQIYASGPDGEREDLRMLRSGEILGEMGVLAGHRRTASAAAVEPTRAWSIERGVFIEIFKSEPAVAIEIAKMMAPYLMDDDDVAEDMLFLDLRQRVAKRLTAVARAAGTPEAPAQTLRLSLEDVAMMAGGTAEDVSFILSEFETNGLIRAQWPEIYLIKPNELTSIAIGL